MLLELHIKNFALIQEVKIGFNDGFNVLCGETGSGKSILIDAINFVLGGKFSKNLIRSGENKTFVQAIFLIEEEYIKHRLNDIGIQYEDYLIISRETFKYGKTITRINNTAVNLSSLKEVTKNILDIHGQHDNIELLDNNEIPDLILLDIMMPGMSGWDTLKTIRENQTWGNIPVVFLTSRSDSISETTGKFLAADFIKKPFDIEDLKRRIDKVLKSSSHLQK